MKEKIEYLFPELKNEGRVMFIPTEELEWDKHVKPTPNLLRSIAAEGVVTPIVVTRSYNGYEVLDGARRCAAAKQLGIEEMPVMLFKHKSTAVTMAANMVRSRNFAAEFKAFATLVAKGADIALIAEKTGLSINQLKPFQRLLEKVTPEGQIKLIENKISFSTAKALAGLTFDEQVECLGDPSEERTNKEVREAIAKRKSVVKTLNDLAPVLVSQDIDIVNLLNQALQLSKGVWANDNPEKAAFASELIQKAIDVVAGKAGEQ